MDIPQPIYRSLDRMVFLTVSCGAVSAAGLPLLYCLPRVGSRGTFWAMFTGFAVLSLGGLLLMILIGSRLRDGIQNERWPSEQADRWRSRTRSPWWLVLLGLPLLLMFVGMFAGYKPLYWAAFIAVQTLSQLSGAFRKPVSFINTGSLLVQRDWRNFGTITSDHWGQR